MTRHLVCDACAADEEIECIGVIRRPPAKCACCDAELPVGANGLVEGNPVGDAQLAKIFPRVNNGAQAYTFRWNEQSPSVVDPKRWSDAVGALIDEYAAGSGLLADGAEIKSTYDPALYKENRNMKCIFHEANSQGQPVSACDHPASPGGAKVLDRGAYVAVTCAAHRALYNELANRYFRYGRGDEGVEVNNQDAGRFLAMQRAAEAGLAAGRSAVLRRAAAR